MFRKGVYTDKNGVVKKGTVGNKNKDGTIEFCETGKSCENVPKHMVKKTFFGGRKTAKKSKKTKKSRSKRKRRKSRKMKK